MASKGQWKGKGVVGGAHLAKSQNQPSKGARKGKGGSLSKSQDQAAKEAPRKGKGKGGDSPNDHEAQFDHNHAECNKQREYLAWGAPTDSASDSPLSDSIWFGHDHAKCIKRREYLRWGTPSDSDSDSPLSPSQADVLFPMFPPGLEAHLDEDEESEALNGETLQRMEFQKLFDALDALEARELSSSPS